MIKEIKTTKAYIRCATSEAKSDKYCPHLQPNKEYKTENDDYFTVYVKSEKLRKLILKISAKFEEPAISEVAKTLMEG